MLTPAEQRVLDAWLLSSGHLGRKCSLCGVIAWKAQVGALVEVTSTASASGWTAVPGGAAVPLVALRCDSCGLVLTFSLERVFPPPGQAP